MVQKHAMLTEEIEGMAWHSTLVSINLRVVSSIYLIFSCPFIDFVAILLNFSFFVQITRDIFLFFYPQLPPIPSNLPYFL